MRQKEREEKERMAKRKIEVKTILPQIVASSGRALPHSLVTSKSVIGPGL